MKIKITTNSQLSTNEPKRRKTMKTKLSKQLQQEQNQRNGHHVEGFLWGGGREKKRGKGTGKKKHNC